jgi:hypothetical protein
VCCLVMNGGMMFFHVVAVVFFSWGPVVSKLAMTFSVVEPMVFHVHCFQILMMLLLTTPSALVLSICIGVGGWG